MSANTRVIQYIVLRGDLLHQLKWPVGALITQACHASTAALHLFGDDEITKNYLLDLDNMHKIVLEAKDEEELKNLSEKLKENKICHKLWIEQPENICTCLATKPYEKNKIQHLFKKFKLFK